MMEGTLHKPDAIGHGTQLCCLNKVGQGASLLAQMVMNLPAMQESWVQSLSWEDSPGERNGYPLQYSCLENPMDTGGAWRATVHEVTKSQT